ncbi:hypothetical protein [Myxococcus sp. RHSTA-1-4]|uniref:hypothetical protein n=1 Tax=Myxococcus sp. RHSTA-1-4 TaxID=2874601 RepID=UPI001CBB7395|nr:hypothetical protein [Myxococcus sp. RHSTA-1-4]MBZ4420675.1 hypothetical protein [Myxococcus sp. RHSTA-1-4]
MAAKASKKKAAKDAPKQDKPRKKAAVATAPENRAHHATLSETQCSDCAVGLLRRFASESLRKQKKVDPGNQKFHLQDDEELELLRTNPLTLQLVGLRRERSLSNRFDDLLVVLYDPALLKEGEKTVLDAEGLRAENLKDAQAYVDAVLTETVNPPAKNWPLPGVDVSCPECKHWRVLVFPITTEPGYDKDKPAIRDEQGNKLPDFDNLTLLPTDVGAIAPGIYNEHYRVGLHKSSANPPTCYAALQFIGGTIPARRRYPVSDYLNAAQAAYDKGTDKALCAHFASEDKEVQEEARSKLEKQLGEKMPQKTAAQKKALGEAVKAALMAENLERYKPKVAEYRKQQAMVELDRWLLGYVTPKKKKVGPKIHPSERLIRLEDAGGAETENFEAESNQVSHLERVEDDASPMKWGLQLVLKPLPPSPPSASQSATTPAEPPPSPTAPAPQKTEAPPPPPLPRARRLTANEVMVTFGTAAGTNIHRSVDMEKSSWGRGREVNDWSEGCQVFRSPQDFRDLLRLAMLAKRAHCPFRTATCSTELTVADVTKGIGKQMTEYLADLPKSFARSAREAITAAFTPPPPPPPPTEDTQPPKSPAPSPAVAADAASPAPDPKLVDQVNKLLEGLPGQKFDEKVLKTFQTVFSTAGYSSAENQMLLEDYTRKKTSDALHLDENVQKAAAGGVPQAAAQKKAFAQMLDQSIDKAIQAGLAELQTKLQEVKKTWLEKQHTASIEDRHQDFVNDRLEPCDFGDCKFKFDYMLAEITRADMEAFVAKLGGRDWNTLFPEDAPPPPPKPAKKAPSKPAADKGKSPAASTGASTP